MRAALGVAACLAFTACWDFEGLLNQCDAGLGPCAPDGGGATGGGGGGGATGGGGGQTDAGTATADCQPDTAQTLLTPDGSTAFCFNGFAWENPLPHGADLSAVWGPAPDDVWAGGAAGMLMHWDGTRWTSHQGELGVQAGVAARLGWITSIVRSPSQTWLAGFELLPHWLDGGTWVPSPVSPGSGISWRVATMGVSADGRGPFAVSNSGDVYSVPGWTRVRAGPTGAERPDFVRQVAVGDDGLVAFSGTFLEGSKSVHRVWNVDGGTWTFDAGEAGPLWFEHGQLLTASTQRTAPSTVTLWALEPDGGTTPRSSLDDDVVFTAAHFLPALDGGFLVGSRMTVADTWGNFVTTSVDPELRAVWAFADGGTWAVGAHGALVQETAGQWVPRQQGFGEDLFGLWVTDAGNFFLAGGNAYVTDRTTGVRRAVGTGTLRDLHQHRDGGWLVASEDGNLWRSGSAPLVYQGQASRPLNALLVDDDEAWAVGIDTIVHRSPDGGWAREAPPIAGHEWWKVARAGARFVIAGSGGNVAVYTLDAGWQVQVESTQSHAFYGVWSPDPQTAWVVGGGPSIWLLHLDTGVFDEQQVIPQFYSGAFFDVWGSAPDDVWAVGSDGLAFHYDGTTWTPHETGTRAMLERVRSRPLPGGGREVVIVGQRGTVLRKRY